MIGDDGLCRCAYSSHPHDPDWVGCGGPDMLCTNCGSYVPRAYMQDQDLQVCDVCYEEPTVEIELGADQF